MSFKYIIDFFYDISNKNIGVVKISMEMVRKIQYNQYILLKIIKI